MQSTYQPTLFQNSIDIKPYFIAHRGATNDAPDNKLTKLPENTTPALLEAYDKGAVYVECDIYLTKDNQIVVIHDDTLERTARYNAEIAGGMTRADFDKLVRKPITELEYADIQRIDVGSFSDQFDPKLRGTRVPLLSEFIAQLSHHPERKLIIELKSRNPELCYKLKELINESIKKFRLLDNQLVFISFEYGLIKLSNKLLPCHKHLLLTISSDNDPDEFKTTLDGSSVGYCYRISTCEDLQRMIKMAKEAKLDGLHVEYCDNINADFVKQIHDYGLLCAVWNRKQDDTPEIANKMLIAGVDLINTNQPEVMFKKCKSPTIHENSDSYYKTDQYTKTLMPLC